MSSLQREVMLDGHPLSLTPKEYNLLAILVQHAGEVVPRETLRMTVWGQATNTGPAHWTFIFAGCARNWGFMQPRTSRRSAGLGFVFSRSQFLAIKDVSGRLTDSQTNRRLEGRSAAHAHLLVETQTAMRSDAVRIDEADTMFNRQWLGVLTVLTALTLPVFADRGKDAFNQGTRAERKANYDAAYEFYKEAYAARPSEPKYFVAYARMRGLAATQHLHAGQLLRNAGSLPEAIAEFQCAVEIDASSFIAQQELQRTNGMLERLGQGRTAPKNDPPLPKLEDTVADSLELRPLSTDPITMHMVTVNADVAYKTICKLAGINVAIDSDYRPQKITLDLTDVTLREALDTVRLLSKTFWRPITKNTIFVTADTTAKRKEHEQNLMKTFYLKNVTTPNDLTEAANVLKQMLDVSRIQLLAGQDALIVRGTADQLILAAKLLADLDKPRPEVVIDVTVMEISRDRIRTLGTTVPTSTSLGYLPGRGVAAGSTSSGGESLLAISP